MTDHSALRPVVLIGAARSGTKAARDAMVLALDIPAVPYDVGYVWRYGNDDMPHDRLTPEDVKPRAARLVRSFLGRYADPEGRLIEKTVGNTLRVGFVAELFPEARFVHLIRDGIDVVESTRRQWLEPADYRYIGEKLRHFPLRLVPSYGRRYVSSILRRRVAGDGRVKSWGPRYPGIDKDLAECDLLKVCARQWTRSVTLARNDLQAVANPSLEVRYEDLVAKPREELMRVAEFAGVQASPDAVRRAAATLVPSNAGAGAARLHHSELEMLGDEMGELLSQLGYQRPRPADLGAANDE